MKGTDSCIPWVSSPDTTKLVKEVDKRAPGCQSPKQLQPIRMSQMIFHVKKAQRVAAMLASQAWGRERYQLQSYKANYIHLKVECFTQVIMPDIHQAAQYPVMPRLKACKDITGGRAYSSAQNLCTYFLMKHSANLTSLCIPHKYYGSSKTLKTLLHLSALSNLNECHFSQRAQKGCALQAVFLLAERAKVLVWLAKVGTESSPMQGKRTRRVENNAT